MRDAIFIIGMHRSGTSAFARVLSLCGAALPLRVMPANYGNPSGYWEPQDAVDLNELYLRACSSSWSDTSFARQLGPHGTLVDDAFVALIADFFETGFEPHGPIVLKEPRITALSSHWLTAARRHGLMVKVVHVFRHPLDVAASLAERDGMERDHAFALWLKYNLVGELEARGTPRVFVSYEELMRDWRSAIGRCVDQLALDLALGGEAQAAVAVFLSPQLRHHDTARAGDFGDSPLAGRVQRLYDILQRAAAGDVDTAALDALRAEPV